MLSSSPPSAVVFDVEGTLTDCVPLILESWRETLGAAGHSFTHRDLQPYSGMDGAWMLDRLLPEESADLKQRLLKAQGEHYQAHYMRQARAFPGVRALFEALRRAGATLGLGTTCGKGELSVYEEQMRVMDLVEAVACGETVHRGKPDPSLFQHCLAELKVRPANALAVGDSPYDAMAAKELGMWSVGVLTGGFSERALRAGGHERVFAQVQDVLGLWEL